MQATVTYKNKIASRYIPVNPDEIGLKITEAEYYLTSVKYNGHFATLQIEKGKAKVYNGSGLELNIPALLKAAESIKQDLLIAGEIVVIKENKPTTHKIGRAHV